MTKPDDEIAFLPPMHPGEVLREEFLIPLGVTSGELAKACKVPRARMERLVAEHSGVTGDTAVRLGHVLGTSPDFWMNLQARYETQTARIALENQLGELRIITRAA